MNNLKRILSLALASVMLVGMMVVGASATDYPDDDKIVNKNAVDTLAALGIMNGDERGFRPEDGLTRAEAAKMLAKLHNKGRDVNFGTKNTPTFTDIKGHWAEGNIEYAAAFGIVNGKGNGIFDPQGSLKVVELVRMTLNMLGYTEGKTGSDWELKTTVLADNTGLFKGLKTYDPSANVTRDQAAQILTNALDALVVDENGNTNTYTYTVQKDVVVGLENRFAVTLATTPGSFETGKTVTDWNKLDDEEYLTRAAAEAAIKAVCSSAATPANYVIDTVLRTVTEKQPVTMTAAQTLGSKYLALNTDATGYITSVKADLYGTYTVVTTDKDGNETAYYYVAEDVSDLMGLQVKVLFKADDDVYGIFASGSQVVWEGTVGEVGAVAANASGVKEIQLGTEKIRIATQTASSVPMISFNGSVAAATNASHANYDNVFVVKAVGNAKGQVVRLVATPVEVGTVTFLNTKNITLSGGLYTGALEDIETYEGVARGDVVVFSSGATNVSGDPSIVKAEMVSGTISSVKDTNTVAIDGNWYKHGSGTALTNAAIRSAVTLTVLNGYYIDHAVNTSISNDLVVVLDADSETANLVTTQLAKILRMDGTTAVVPVSAAASTLVGEICTYNVVNGVYTLTKATPVNTGYTGKLEKGGSVNYVGTGTTTKGKLSNGALIADDAVVLVAYKHGTNTNDTATTVTTDLKALTQTTVISGKDLKTWSIAAYGAGTNTTAMISKVNGIDYVKVLFLAADKQALPGASTTSYGYVVSDVVYTDIGNTTFAQYTVFDGTDNLQVKEANSATAAGKGKFVKFDLKADNVVENVTAYTVGNAAGNIHKAAIMGYNAEEETIILRKDDGTTEAIQAFDKYTKFFTIDSTTQTGVAGINVQLASQNEDGSYTLNAYYTTADRDANRTDDTIDLLFVENYNAILNAGVPETASEKAAELAAPASEKPLAEVAPAGKSVFTLGSGAKGNITGVKDWNATEANLVFFKFDATYGPATQTYTLTIGTTIGGNEVYEETAAGVTNAVHFFGIDKTGTSLAATGAFKTGHTTGLTAGTAYTYTIKGADGIVYASGAFQL